MFFSKQTVLFLALLFPSILAAPIPEPGNVGFSDHSGGFGITRGHKRSIEIEARDPGNIGVSGRPGLGLIRGSKREAEAEAYNNIGVEGTPDLQLTRGSKREAEAAPSPIASNNLGLSGEPDLEFGLTEEKRSNDLGISGSPGFELIRGSKREAEAAPSPVASNDLGLSGEPDLEFGLTEEKRSNDLSISGSPGFELTRGS
ncbi:hypothetical protein BDZ45DRAFT_727359 [Acephala macrosclerotiorum]|nr:hypothetical protein BDZ45DRAFT_727359 [Acephala macrosclerotiorum]